MTNTDIAQAIYLVSKDKEGKELSDSLNKVVNFLSRKRFLSKASEIFDSLDKIINKAEGRMVVYITSVSKINEETKNDITQLLKKKYDAKEFVYIENIDSTLLGGVRIEINNEIIDLSIKNKIGQLQDYLVKN